MANFACVFPGQGSQSVGMLGDLHEQFPVISDTFSEASEALGLDLWQLASTGPEEAQALTANTQPLILTASVAIFRLWVAQGGSQPSVAAGHSLGEFSALVAAGSLDLGDGVRLVRRRGEAMQAAVPVGVGAMAAIIGLDDERINEICAATSTSASIVSAVNYNSPGQVVIAGHREAVDSACTALKEAGARRTLPLPVSAPFHTSLMIPAGRVLENVLADVELKAPLFPVVSNVDARPKRDEAEIRQLLVQQIASPVQWTASMHTMIAQGMDTFVECGPGRVLSGLARRIDKNKPCFTTDTATAFEAALKAL